jgi:hypothetical protein
LAVDGAGRVHFLGQIRYPVGIYHSYWDGAQWSSPSLIYLIAQEGEAVENGAQIHAHGLNPVIRAGNQLILTLGDGPADPNRRLYAMYLTLEDVAPREPENMPPPVLGPTPVAVSSAVDVLPTSPPPATVPAFDTASAPPASIPGANQPLRVALIPTILLIGGAIAGRLLLTAIRTTLLRLFK